MAVDEALLETSNQPGALPILRLYAWKPPCLSLGYAQPIVDVDSAALNHLGWELVRRPTGGRAILHTDELTYSVMGSQNEPSLAGSVLESYYNLSQALLFALRQLGMPAQASEKPELLPGSDPKGPVCFEVPSNYEITVHGKKLIGSAQARRKDGVLQHGSLPLSGDLTRIIKALAYPGEAERTTASQRLLRRACTAETILGRPLHWQEAAQAFIAAFEETLNIQFEQSELTRGEQKRASALLQSRFANPDWTSRI
jgi:lipoate-protein ligase A